MSSEERARAVDKLNVDCIIRPRNDNSALLTSQPANQPTELLPRWNMLCSKEEMERGRGVAGHLRRDVSVRGMIRQTNSPPRCTNVIRSH